MATTAAGLLRHVPSLGRVLGAGVQNSFRCLAAENLCLAKRVNRDISEMSFLDHFRSFRVILRYFLPFWVIFWAFWVIVLAILGHFGSCIKSAWQNKKSACQQC